MLTLHSHFLIQHGSKLKIGVTDFLKSNSLNRTIVEENGIEKISGPGRVEVIRKIPSLCLFISESDKNLVGVNDCLIFIKSFTNQQTNDHISRIGFGTSLGTADVVRCVLYHSRDIIHREIFLVKSISILFQKKGI